jgi:hypothetical protein
MTKKHLFNLLLTFLIGCTSSQQDNKETTQKQPSADFEFPILQGWTAETFTIPISFAPEIDYKGTEQVRFSPNWSKLGKEDYWTYAFLWTLEGQPDMTTEIIESNLENYYRGLVVNNFQQNKRIFNGKVESDARFEAIETESGDVKTFRGSVKTIDYLSAKPFELFVKVHLKQCSDKKHSYVLYEISPQTFSHSVWKELEKVNQSFGCS